MERAASQSGATTERYCRQVRHLRYRMGSSVPRLHAALRELNEKSEGSAPAARESPPLPGQLTGTPATLFATRVADSCDGSVLRYSMRQRLLREAERLGIGRFEANLIIATVQHRLREDQTPAAPTPSRLWPVLTVGLILEAAILAAAWRLLG